MAESGLLGGSGLDPVKLYVSGIRELRAALRKVEPELLPELRVDLKAAAEVVAADARRRAPQPGNVTYVVRQRNRRSQTRVRTRTGAARDSIRVVAGGNSIYLAGGKAKTPYYGWLDFGGKLPAKGGRRNTQVRPIIRRGRYIYPAIDANIQLLADRVGAAVDRTLAKLDLK